MLQNRAGTSANQGQGECVTKLRCKARETATNPPGGRLRGEKGRLAHGNVCAGNTRASRGRLAPRRSFVWRRVLRCRVRAGIGAVRRCPDRRRRQPSRRSRNDPFLFQSGAGRAPRCRQDRCRAEGALQLGPVSGRPHFAIRRPPDCHRRRSPGHRPHRVRGQQPAQGRAASAGNPVEGARHAVEGDGAGRRHAHHRGLSPQRPLRRSRGAEDHRAAEQPRRPRLRNQGRRKDRRQDPSSSSAITPIRIGASRR